MKKILTLKDSGYINNEASLPTPNAGISDKASLKSCVFQKYQVYTDIKQVITAWLSREILHLLFANYGRKI